MPLYRNIQPNPQTNVLVWHINESIDELSHNLFLSEKSKIRLDNMQSEVHRKGFLSIRKLLEQLGYTDKDLFYTSDGKPHLTDGKSISITHSFDFSAIIVCQNPVGIDVEKNRDKIKRIAPKFIASEKHFITHQDEIEMLTVIWGAKESLYKIHPDGGLLFKEHLPIEPFSLKDKKTKGWIKKDKYYEIFNIYFDIFEGYSLVYAVN